MERCILKTRQTVFNILCEVCINKAYANLYLRNVDKDIPYLTKVIYGTLQNHLYLDYFVRKHTTKLKEKIRLLLLLATYELKFMDSENYAVINEFVEISKGLYKGSYTKLVNAILRKIATDNEVAISDEDEKLSILTSHPLWLIKMWNKQYGKELTSKMCYANLEDKIQYIRLNPKKINKAKLLENPAFQENEKGIYYVKGNATNSELYQNGCVSIQDVSSQAVSLFLEPKPHDLIIDICAAPGSKTLHIAELTNDEAQIVALDLYESRVQLIEDAKKRLGYSNIACICADAITYQSEILFDKVLVDAVCSGYGVLKGKSDIKYHMQPTDMDEIIKNQCLILENSSLLVKKAGILVYSTCTLNKKENELQIQKFLQNHDDFELVEEKTIFPFQQDGFYMAKLRRIK